MPRANISAESIIFLQRMSRRTISVTPEGRRFLLLTLAVAVAAVNTGNNLFYLLLAMLLSLVVISGLLSEFCVRRLAFRRHVPPYIFANQPAWVLLTVSNRKPHVPSFSLRLYAMADRDQIDREIHIPHLAPRASILASYTFQATRRGLYHLQGIRVATPFPFGLFQKKAFYPDETAVLVCPALIPLPSPILQELTAIGQNQALARRGPGMALSNLREYRPGDDSRAIHWMTTARTSKLMLKETEADDQRVVTILLSPIAPATYEAAFERAISVAASLVTHFHDRAYVIRAIIGEQDSGAAAGAAHYVHILRTLALCERRDPGGSGLNDSQRALTPGQPDTGMVLAIIPWSADQWIANSAGSADCVITTAEPGEPINVARSSVFS